MHLFFLPATLLLGLSAVLASSVANTAKSTNPILNILTNITETSQSLSEQTSGPMDLNADRQYKGSVRYYVKFIQDLNRTNKNFPQLPSGLNGSAEQATCDYFYKDFYRSQTRLPIDLAANCYTSGTKGSWCNYLVICLRTYIPLLAQVEEKIINTTPSCAAKLRTRVGTIKSFQDQAVERIEKGRYYRKLPFKVPADS
ncbi:hypothetical protein E4U17_006220 [Claviceps sp. LM77 group G4]|nr:hypothetical protein E4U33_001235 [Claviceps sp. LM78 group G4]KAG6051370.1 hypothetical protein E4U17_006220 [Claviceps sp. LM77 group G4]KAG6067886.1 hypothetical protein E4U16_008079 [Claviceps sp. LM84 group G4]